MPSTSAASFDREAGEVAQLHQLGFARVVRGESIEGFVDGEEFVVLFDRCGDLDVVRVHVLGAAAVFGGELAAGAVDEDAPHGLGGGAEEVGAVFKALVAEPQPRLMDERGGLERVAGLLAGHLRAGELAQLGIDLREQRAGGVGFAAVDGVEEEREVGHGGAIE